MDEAAADVRGCRFRRCLTPVKRAADAGLATAISNGVILWCRKISRSPKGVLDAERSSAARQTRGFDQHQHGVR
jgi:hypothetical protein